MVVMATGGGAGGGSFVMWCGIDGVSDDSDGDYFSMVVASVLMLMVAPS